MPEVDSPGHTASWQIGYPEVGVAVPGDWYSGMVDPTKEASFTLLDGLFGELAALFEDQYVHIGCDEVDFAALNNTASVVAYMAAHGIPRTARGLKSLIARYIERLSAIVAAHGKVRLSNCNCAHVTPDNSSSSGVELVSCRQARDASIRSQIYACV